MKGVEPDAATGAGPSWADEFGGGASADEGLSCSTWTSGQPSSTLLHQQHAQGQAERVQHFQDASLTGAALRSLAHPGQSSRKAYNLIFYNLCYKRLHICLH